KQIARVVRQQEALFSSVYEGLIAVDPHGYITAINRNARKMLGLRLPLHHRQHAIILFHLQQTIERRHPIEMLVSQCAQALDV
ncbi:hypothetical protein ACSLNT_29745, partial [Escherichia coli]|uniref:hypothetical protein n=1 Tax=Escherichia coli TaxID=562 RepID=UPI003EE332FD